MSRGEGKTVEEKEQAKTGALSVASTMHQKQKSGFFAPWFLPVENQINLIYPYGCFKYQTAEAFVQSDITDFNWVS